MTDDLTSYLQLLHIDAGSPSIRDISRATGIGRTRVHDYLRGEANTATWNRLAPLVSHLNGNPARAQKLWAQAKERTTRTKSASTTEQLATIIELLTDIRDQLRTTQHDD